MSTYKNNCIGIFDSGIGGLTVVKSILEEMPNENIIYLADTKHLPYGNKTNEQIIKYVKEDVDFLSSHNPKAIIIACNTADSIAYKTIANNSNIPIYGVVDSTVNKTIKTTINKKVGVIATDATVNSCSYNDRIKQHDKNINVYSVGCPNLVSNIENLMFNFDNQDTRKEIEYYLKPLIEKGIDTLVLGCTHFDLLTSIIKDMYPKLMIVSSSRCVVNEIKNSIEHNVSNGKIDYYVTSNEDIFNKKASLIMKDVNAKLI